MIAGSLVVLAVLGAAAPAAAERTGAYGTGGGVDVFAGNSGDPGGSTTPVSTSGGGGGGGGSVPTCVGDMSGEGDALSPNGIPHSGEVSYTPATEEVAAELERRDPHDEPGTWYRVDCGGAYSGYVWFPAGSGPAAAAADPAVLAEEALRHLPLPKPEVNLTPPPDKVLVNANLWLSIDPSQWSQRQATASVPGVSATVVAVPQKVVWDMGDGRTVTCDGPGRAYDPSAPYASQSPECGHTYTRSSAGQPGPPANAYVLTATVHWHATWTSSGVAGGGDLGIVTSTSDPFALRANEIQTVVVAGGGRP